MDNMYGKVKGFLVGAALVPALGLAAHALQYAGDKYEYIGDDYSLKHRFENAYCFDVPASHRYYTVENYKNENSPSQESVPYDATPWLTYPLTLAMGALGAHRRWDKKLVHAFENAGR